jgi:hypothetical protein
LAFEWSARLHWGSYGLCSQEQVVDHILRVANSTPGHLVLLLTMARGTRLHGIHCGASQQSAMSDVSMALEALQIVGQMGSMVDFMARVLCPDVGGFVAFRTGFCVDLSSEDRAPFSPRHTGHDVTGAVEMGLELPDYPRFGMASYAVGFGVD